MTTITYSAMTAASAITGAEIVPIVQSGANVRTTVTAIKSYVDTVVVQALLPPLNLQAYLGTAGTSITFTADQLTLSSSLSTGSIALSSYSQTLDISTTGVGGVDTGTIPNSSFFAIYAIYNPTTLTASILATTATATEIYSGVNLPSGYTYSRLISLWPMGVGSMSIGYQQGRTVSIAEAAVTTGTALVSWTSVSLATQLPAKAKSWSGYLVLAYGGGVGSCRYYLSPQGSLVGDQRFDLYTSTAVGIQSAAVVTDMPLVTPQVVYYQVTNNAFTTASLYVTSYSF